MGGTPPLNIGLEYQYNSIGDMTGVKYPGWSGFATVAYGDGRRPDGMTQPGGNNFARYAEYDYLGRMSSLQMLETAYSERCRSAFRTDADRDSNLMPITIPK